MEHSLSQAFDHQACWWLVFCPGLLIFATVVAINLVGERLRDAIDPRLATHTGER